MINKHQKLARSSGELLSVSRGLCVGWSLYCSWFVPVACAGVLVLVAPSVRAQSEASSDYAPALDGPVSQSLPSPSTRWRLIGAGFGVTLGFYAIAQPFAYSYSDTAGVRYLRVPVAGPWLSLAHNGCSGSDSGCSSFSKWTRGILTTLDGLGQVGGLFVVVEGLFLKTAAPRRADVTRPGSRSTSPTPSRKAPSASDDEETEAPPRSLFFAPFPMGVGDSGVGFNVFGTF